MMQLPPDHASRMSRARLSLDGLSVGDAFGGRFFTPADEFRTIPRPPWSYSDDTEMAMAVVSILNGHGQIDPDALALDFARRYQADPYRGYGLTVRQVLEDIAEGTHWSLAAAKVYGGKGSLGNGGAMRSAPIGTYFSDDMEAVVDQARISAALTHAHFEGQVGAIAVALAAAWACQNAGLHTDGRAMLKAVLAMTPESDTRRGVEQALAVEFDAPVEVAVKRLGNGSRITAPDTVPFALWCAAGRIDDFTEALWIAASAGGDNDTNGAIVGGIVALATGSASIPEAFLEAREALKS